MDTTRSLLRERNAKDSGKVGMVELFFDLVFVFAVTQLSHALLAHLTVAGAIETGLLLLAVWWVWICTCWVTNWLDTDRIPVRLCMFGLMLMGLLISVSIPKAFSERGLAFAFGYAAMHIGRTVFFLWAARSGPHNLVRNFQRILIWLCGSAVLWIAGGLTDGTTRLILWTIALASELGSPWIFFWVPGLGRSTIADWQVDGSHMAERCALFVIIALGESLLVTGATFADLGWTTSTITAAIVGVLGTIAMWWIYFDTGAERAHHRIVASDDPGRQARSAYTYLHLPIVGGIIVCAVADELVLAHPDRAANPGIAAILGGPALFLFGTLLFKWATSNRLMPPLSHLGGLTLLLILAPFAFGHVLSALALGTLTTVILVVVATWESTALRRHHAGGHHGVKDRNDGGADIQSATHTG